MKKIVLFFFLLYCTAALAHPMPNSILELSVSGNKISGIARMPVLELEGAIAPQGKTITDKAFLLGYFLQHIAAKTGINPWRVKIGEISFTEDTDALAGKYKEVIIGFTLIPPPGITTRNFSFNYSAIVHQVVTHKVLVFLKQDWQNGVYNEDAEGIRNEENLIGVIQTDIASGKIFPLQVSLKKGSNLEGFKAMIRLGMHHISEGTDHLLFLLVLLLTAPLIPRGKNWGPNKGLFASLKKILKITLAFTLGHSITLALATLGWVNVPSQPIEIIIALSILVTGVHAIKPLFPHRESGIACGFGLVHGLAFATILTGFSLTGKTLALSLLGFNLGIEFMQLVVIIVTVPWLIVLSKYRIYKYVRLCGAILASVAAFAWLAERISGKQNIISVYLEKSANYGKYLVLIVTIITLYTLLRNPRKSTVKQQG
jgi:hypothetical protein